MMKGTSFFKKVFIVLLFGMLTVFMAGNRSMAATGVVDITNLQDVEVLSSGNTNKTSTSNTTSNKTDNTNKQTNSSSKDKSLPATGSNTEIIFVIGGIALVSFVVYVYKKSAIKLK